jgi:hypothetical protein
VASTSLARSLGRAVGLRSILHSEETENVAIGCGWEPSLPDTRCFRCAGTGFVCQAHPDLPWSGAFACDCGSRSKPCPSCDGLGHINLAEALSALSEKEGLGTTDSLSGLTMHGYRAYIIGADGHIQRCVELFCKTEDDAKAQAKQLVDGHAVELWGPRPADRSF